MNIKEGKRRLLIGVDVGGTNSDLVVLDPAYLNNEPAKFVLAWHKTVTTPDVSEGIKNAIRHVLDDPSNLISKDEIAAVTIGTTHFINAVIERDANRLEKVAVLRLSGPFGKGVPPFADFPQDLADVIYGYHGFLDGGVRVDGVPIQPLNEKEVKEHVNKIKELGINSIAVISIFPSVDPSMELRTKEIIEEIYPDCDIVLSHTISGLGFVERENATVLNASIKKFGRKIIKSFIHATKKLGLTNSTVLLSQNDGTVLSIKDALETPIKTFSSGATNSMRGASILCSHDPDVVGKNVMVCDVGGTTTDVGQLLSSGFPRQSALYSYVGGVKVNFSMPHVESIGLGGGSIVRNINGKLTIGPDSTGAEIINKAILFGGNTITTSDVTISKYLESMKTDELPNTIKMGNPLNVLNKFTLEYKSEYSIVIKKLLERVIDKMKTSADPIPVIFVGGGSFIAPDNLEGASKVIKPPFFQVANAVGAALGKISCSLSDIKHLSGSEEERKNVIDELIKRANSDAVERGALKSSVTVVDIVSDIVPYTDRVYKFEVKVVGDVDYDRVISSADLLKNDLFDNNEEYEEEKIYKNVKVSKTESKTIDFTTYKPKVVDGFWYLTPTDIDFIGNGAYILGCGGGGSPNSHVIELKNMLRNGHEIKVITLEKFDKITNGKGHALKPAYIGSPTISHEKLHGDELLDSIKVIETFEGRKIDAMGGWEVGGSNGMCGLWCAASLKIPFVDLDSLGRAYPTCWQSTTSVVHNGKGYPYCAMSDGNGFEVFFKKVVNDKQLEDAARDCIYRQGCRGGMVFPSRGIKDLANESIMNTLSLAWRIGRAVFIARNNSDLDNLPKRIIDATGDESKRIYTIPFKNENIAVIDEESKDILCSVPDLITCVDVDGNAVGTQDYRYGLIVYVMAFAPSPMWTTEQGILKGGPKGFDKEFHHIEYKPIGKHYVPIPVTEEFK
ncbi:hypothetical protein C6P42_002781 [Pichia californica]|nr:hypothetical protein C6P42_002781 [[Candida] californica]